MISNQPHHPQEFTSSISSTVGLLHPHSGPANPALFSKPRALKAQTLHQSGTCLLLLCSAFSRPYLLITQHNTHSGTVAALQAGSWGCPHPSPPSTPDSGISQRTLCSSGSVRGLAEAHLRKSVTIPKQEGGGPRAVRTSPTRKPPGRGGQRSESPGRSGIPNLLRASQAAGWSQGATGQVHSLFQLIPEQKNLHLEDPGCPKGHV